MKEVPFRVTHNRSESCTEMDNNIAGRGSLPEARRVQVGSGGEGGALMQYNLVDGIFRHSEISSHR